MGKETHTTERMLQLKDYRSIGKIIHPQKWDVLIRIIDNADQQAASRRSGDDKSSTTTYGGRKTAASSMTAQELRSMSEVMVDYGYSQAVSSTADRSGTEIMETDHYIEASSASAAAYYHQAGAGSYREERR